jgi:hypothetical protein
MICHPGGHSPEGSCNVSVILIREIPISERRSGSDYSLSATALATSSVLLEPPMS